MEPGSKFGSARYHEPWDVVKSDDGTTMDFESRRSLRKQYHFWKGDAWDVHRLIDLCTSLPVEDVPLATITEIDSVYWYDGSKYLPTVRDIIEHVRLLEAADLSYPIILAHDGRVMDGMHRIAKALLQGRTTIKAVRLPTAIEPDYRNCTLSELPYD